MIRINLTLFSALLAATSIFAAEKPNVVIILTDDMGYGDPGCYNPDSKIPTPNIDQLATDGMRFTDAHAAGPLCHVSRYGLMTGRYPFRKKIQWKNNAVIDEGRMTIASMLRSSGYETAMVGKWHLGFFEDEKFEGPLRGGPADRGFNSYFGIRASTDIPPYFYIRGTKAVTPPTGKIAANNTEGWSPIQGAFWREGGIAPDLKLEEVMPRFTTEAVSVIENHAAKQSDKPLMLYLAYPAPHTPWLPTKPFHGKSGAGSYGDFVNMVDFQIGEVLKALENSGMSDDTLVIFTADNGPVWYDADVEKYGHDSSGGLRGMKADAWENGHRMPFIVRWPDMIKSNSISDQTICFTDVFATLADLVDAHIPEHQAPDSESFLPVLTGEQSEDEAIRGPIVLAAGKKHFMIRSGDWKFIDGWGSGGFSKIDKKLEKQLPRVQLYNLKDDLGETTNLQAERPEKVAELSQSMETIRTGSSELTASNFGELIFHDDFERTESQELKDEPGNGWTTSSEKTAAGQKQVDLRDGAMHMHTAEGANHAASTRHAFAFADGTIGMRFKLDDDGDKLQLNFADMKLKSVHAGHLFDAVIGLDNIQFEDKKTSFMDLNIRKANQAGTLSAEEKSELLKTKRKSVTNEISKGEWHDLLVHVDGNNIAVVIDEKAIGEFQSEGFAHPTKNLLRLLVPGHASVDDVKIWRKK